MIMARLLMARLLMVLPVAATPAEAQTRPTTFSATTARPNQLTDGERAAGWRLLFDGRTLTGWRGLGHDTVPTAHWKIADGTIKKIASGKVPRVPDGRPLNGGDLMPVETVGHLELRWEWTITPGANSGVTCDDAEE